jgi:IS1 family transposase
VIVESPLSVLELDELYWFIKEKPRTETRENTYVFTMVSREPRLLAGVAVSCEKKSSYIQKIVDDGPDADYYCTDGYVGYLDVLYPGKHIRNMRDKSDTFTVEGVNADLRHYIPILARRSRCFPRSLETLRSVVEVFADAYNRFGLAKFKYRLLHKCKDVPFGLIDFL